jgi:hypothetical protein
VRRDAVLKLEDFLEKLDLCATKLSHLGAVLGSTQHCDKGDEKDFDEIVLSIVGSRIGNQRKRGGEELQDLPKLRESSQESTIRGFASEICSLSNAIPLGRGRQPRKPIRQGPRRQ